jgi:hypothetical protein
MAKNKCRARESEFLLEQRRARNKDPNVWVRLVQESTPKSGNVFLSDLRFPNEFITLKNEGWICIKILRDHSKNREGTGTVLHSSEMLIDSIHNNNWDFIIDNNENKENFYSQLDIIIQKLSKEKNA